MSTVSTMRSLVSGLLVVSIVVTAHDQSVDAAPGDVVVNELHYHPEDDDPDGEFVELYNRGASPVDLSGWCIDGVDHCFAPGTTLGGRSFLVTTSASWGGRLSNGGEDISLIDADGGVVDVLEYDDKEQWPANADGEGASLQRLDVSSPADDPGNWWGDAPTPGATNRLIGASRPVWDDVEHSILPAAGEPVRVTGTVTGAKSAQLQYRIGFGGVMTVTAPIGDGGVVSVEIPGQAAGALVRYRLVGYGPDGDSSTWPRQGDGATYLGTTVARSTTSQLPRFEWFMPDDEYAVAVADLSLRGDDGYPAVFVHDGQVFDNTKVRVKGQTSRFWPKKKWKFVLPAGHELEIDGVFPEAVDEFALHSGWSDKSFLRETLASEFMETAGLPVSQAFPIRLERNGGFYGLYTYVEQRDGTFRDRQEYGDATVYEVGGNDLLVNMAPGEAAADESLLRRYYDKDTNEYEDDDALRDLILNLNAPAAQRRAYVERHVDVASVINTIAASAVIQHQDFGQKNFDLILSDQGLWQITPTDFDLTFGRRPNFVCGSLCDAVVIGGSFEHPGTPLFATLWFDPEWSDLIRQRIRTLTERHFDADVIGARVAELRDRVAAEARLDRATWSTYGSAQPPGDAAGELMSRFVIPQERRLLGPLVGQGRVAATSEPDTAAMTITSVSYDGDGVRPPHVIVRNDSGRRVDIGGYAIDGIDLTFGGATFLNPGQSVVAVSEDSGDIVGMFATMQFGGVFHDDLDDADDGLVLTDRSGRVLDTWDLVPPGELTEFSGRPGESAVVSLVAVRAQGRGYLQILDCDGEEGGTANLTLDTAGQTRAGAAVARFDDEGRLCVFNSSPTHLVVDVQGYVAADAIVDLPDERLLDTRDGVRPTAGSTTRLTGTPATSTIVSLSAVRADGRGYLQVLDCDDAPGSAANLTVDAPEQTRTGLAVVRFDESGEVCIFTSVATDIVVDRQAEFSDEALDDVIDRRLVDTRESAKPPSGGQVELTGVPDTSAIVSLVATQTTGRGYFQLLPCGASPGATANLNADSVNQRVSNLAIVDFDGEGRACVFVETSAHVVVDLQALLTTGSFDDIADERVLDTR